MAEKEYIEREALISDIKELPEQERIEYMGIYDCIKSHPTADVQEVVRCKDCSYFCKATVNKKGFLICPASGMDITNNDFCSYGAKMDKE